MTKRPPQKSKKSLPTPGKMADTRPPDVGFKVLKLGDASTPMTDEDRFFDALGRAGVMYGVPVWYEMHHTVMNKTLEDHDAPDIYVPMFYAGYNDTQGEEGVQLVACFSRYISLSMMHTMLQQKNARFIVIREEAVRPLIRSAIAAWSMLPERRFQVMLYDDYTAEEANHHTPVPG